MSSLSFVRELVKELMEADADEEERVKGKLKMRKILKPESIRIRTARSIAKECGKS
jgi:hypothetical protein